MSGLRLPMAFLLLLAAGCEPRGPLPGGRLDGELVAERIDDWSFAANHDRIEIETRSGSFLRSASTWFFVHEGTLYLYAASPVEFGWIRRLREEDPNLMLRLDGKLYPVRAEALVEPGQIEPLLPAMLSKYYAMEVVHIRWVGPTRRFPGTQLRQWFFRIES
jgi:hypothetical protein